MTSPRLLTTVLTSSLLLTILLASWLTVGASPTRIAAAITLCLAVPAMWLAWTRPIVFPLSAYAAVVPFNDIVRVGQSGTVTFLLGFLSAIALIVALVRARRLPQPGTAIVAWWALTTLSVLSGLWALEPARWASLTVTFVQLVSLYSITAFYPFTKSDLQWFFGGAIAGAAAAGAYGTYLFANAMFITPDHRLFIRNATTTADPNNFAAALLMPLAVAIVVTASSRDWRVKLVGASMILAILSGIVVTSSRGAFLAILVITVYILVRLRERVQVLIVSALSVLAAFPAWPILVTRVTTALGSGGAGRTDIWRVGLEAFKAHWLFGAGLGNYMPAFDMAFLRVRVAPYRVHWHRAPHNLFQEYSVELGVIGTLVLLWAWWSTFRATKSIDISNPLYPIKIGVEAGVIGLFVAAIFLDIMFTKYTWLAFIAVAGTCTAAQALAHTETREFGSAVRRLIYRYPTQIRSTET